MKKSLKGVEKGVSGKGEQAISFLIARKQELGRHIYMFISWGLPSSHSREEANSEGFKTKKASSKK